jgi:hypothetical protein
MGLMQLRKRRRRRRHSRELRRKRKQWWRAARVPEGTGQSWSYGLAAAADAVRGWPQIQGGGGSAEHVGDVMILVFGLVFSGAALVSAWNSG